MPALTVRFALLRPSFLACAAVLGLLACSRDDADAGTSALRSAPSVSARPAVAPPDSMAELEAALDGAIGTFFTASGSAATSQYQTARLDLNGDGRPEGLVYVYDTEWCGSGGCTLLVFEGTDSGFRFLSETSLVNGPVVVSEHRTNGWRDLVVPDPAEDRVLALQHGGDGYPSGPEGPPAPRARGEVIFEGEVGLF